MTTNQKRLPAFTDTDPMPFGKHQGALLQDVPARYLQWLWREGLGSDSRHIDPSYFTGDASFIRVKLANYIWNSQDAIAQETGERL